MKDILKELVNCSVLLQVLGVSYQGTVLDVLLEDGVLKLRTEVTWKSKPRVAIHYIDIECIEVATRIELPENEKMVS